MVENQRDSRDEPSIPAQAGLGLAAVVLGAECVPAAVYLGVQCLALSLPVFGLWFFLPVVVLAVVLGMAASRTAHGVAGAALGVAALLVCLCFTLADRMYGGDIRGQLRPPAASIPGLKLDQLLKMKPAGGIEFPSTRPSP